MDRYNVDSHSAEPQATDARLRDVFRRNAPPANETRLAAALRPQGRVRPATTHVPIRKRPRQRHPLRLATVIAGTVVLAAAIGIGGWQAAAHLGEGSRMVLITDQTTSTAPDAAARLADGVWDFRADRQGNTQGIRLPSDEIPEEAYQTMTQGPVFSVVISEGESKVSIEGEMGGNEFSVLGTRTSDPGDRVRYDLEAFASGRFVIWPEDGGLQAELTVYGSGVPVIFSYRGALVKAARHESFDDIWAASVAAVNALGPTRVIVTQTVTVLSIEDEDHANSTKEPEAVVTMAEELLDPARDRARLVVQTPDRIITRTYNGGAQLTVSVDPLSSAKAPATFIMLDRMGGLPLPLWAGGNDADAPGYESLLAEGYATAKHVESEPDGNTRLSWRLADKSDSSHESTLTLGGDLLPVLLKTIARETVAGTRIERTTIIEYEFEKNASFQDSEFSTQVPDYAELTS